jgi:hypothetical protein
VKVLASTVRGVSPAQLHVSYTMGSEHIVLLTRGSGVAMIPSPHPNHRGGVS